MLFFQNGSRKNRSIPTAMDGVLCKTESIRKTSTDAKDLFLTAMLYIKDECNY